MTATTVSARKGTELREIALDLIQPSPLNPRTTFDAEPLQELADSIREHGILEPLVLRPLDGSNWYQIIAGERRYRAAILAGLESVPAVIRGGVDDATHLQLAMLENLQRENLNPIEEAEGLKKLKQLGMKQTSIAAAIGRSEPAVANSLRLLELPEDVQEHVRAGRLTAAHAKALASTACNSTIQVAIATVAVRDNWTSKEIERLWHRPYYHLPSEIRKFYYALDSYETAFDRAPCGSDCPHNAYRSADGNHYCLRPACYEEKQKAGKAAREAAAQERVRKAVGNGVKLPLLSDIPYDTYASFAPREIPEKCLQGEGCKSLSKAIDRADKVVSICTKPSCYRAILTAETKAQNKAGRALMKRLLLDLEKRIDGLTAIGPREMAVVGEAAAANNWHLRTHIRTACERQGQKKLWGALDAGYVHKRDRLPVMTELGILVTGKVLVEATCRMELVERYQERRVGDSPTADWYLEDPSPTVAPAIGDEPPSPTDQKSLLPTCARPVAYALRWKGADGRSGTVFSCHDHMGAAMVLASSLGQTVETEMLDPNTAGKVRCFWTDEEARP